MSYQSEYRSKTAYMGVALATLLSAVLAAPAHASGNIEFNAGYIALTQRNYERALLRFTNVIKYGGVSQPNVALAYHLRGVGYLKTGRYDEAILDFNQALAMNPTLATAHNDRAIAYRHKGDFAKAFADYSEAIRINPRVDSFYLNRGLAYAKSRLWDEAISDYKLALLYKPGNVPALVALGDARMEMGQHKDALAAYRQAMGEQRDLLRTYPWIGVKLTTLGESATSTPVANNGGPAAKVIVAEATAAGDMIVLDETP